MRAIASILFFINVFLAGFAGAQFQVPALQGPVMDTIGLLSPATRDELSQVLQQFHRQGKAQIQVFIVDSLKGEAIESVSIKITDQWKLGDKQKDNGILFLVAMKEHRMRIEVGQGLEGVVPDIYAKRIVSDVVKPRFNKRLYAEGITAGVKALIQLIDPEFAAQVNKRSSSESSVNQEGSISTSTLIILLVLFGVLFVLIFFSQGGGPFFGGGGGMSGGGGWPTGSGRSNDQDWSGGGGGFSGGGASGDWDE